MNLNLRKKLSWNTFVKDKNINKPLKNSIKYANIEQVKKVGGLKNVSN